jgi:cysteinyl-tRNA synthetase
MPESSTEIQVYNTLGRSKQIFVPRTPGEASMYTCGVTVYRYAHVGNMRTYLMSDFWTRALRYLGYHVRRVQNITDVGHLQNDVEGTGEDRMMIAAQDEGKSPEEIAEFYNQAFMEDAALLRIEAAEAYPRATEFIPQMIDVVKKLEDKGLTYEKNGNVFYDVEKLDGEYPKLSHNTLDQLQAGYRIEVDPEKRNPADFLLWKAGGEHRLQIWDSPWGPGFPGWHLECSAMSMEYFPEGFDIHTGGIDLVFPHHEDEIAQSEPILGHQPANYWIHGEHLQMDGRKMAKSTGNVVRIADLVAMGYDPLAFRFLYLSAKYRAKQSFSLEVLEAASQGLNALHHKAWALPPATAPESEGARALEHRFRAALADDLDLPQVSVLLQDVFKADVPDSEKRALLERWDEVLQLDLTRAPEAGAEATEEAPAEVHELAHRRDEARAAKDFAAADSLRAEIEAAGWSIEDSAGGSRLRKRKG